MHLSSSVWILSRPQWCTPPLSYGSDLARRMDRGWCSVVLVSRRSTPTPAQIDSLGLMHIDQKRAALRCTFCQRSTHWPEAHHFQLCCSSMDHIADSGPCEDLRCCEESQLCWVQRWEKICWYICEQLRLLLSLVKSEPLKYLSESASWTTAHTQRERRGCTESEREREKRERRLFRLRQSGAPELPHHANSSQALMISPWTWEHVCDLWYGPNAVFALYLFSVFSGSFVHSVLPLRAFGAFAENGQDGQINSYKSRFRSRQWKLKIIYLCLWICHTGFVGNWSVYLLVVAPLEIHTDQHKNTAKE